MFPKLTDLSCSNCGLKELDLSKNVNLKNLNCEENQLTSIDLSHNTALNDLRINDNKLKSLDISKNKNLSNLLFHNNNIACFYNHGINRIQGLTDDNRVQQLDVEVDANDMLIPFTKLSNEFDKSRVLNIEGATIVGDAFKLNDTVPSKVVYDYNFHIPENTRKENCINVTLNITYKNLEKVNVSFDNNKGSGTMKDIAVYKGSDCILPECTFEAPNTDLEFDYWEVNGARKNPGDRIPVTAPIIVKAIWKTATKYKVNIAPTEHGQVKVEPELARKGDTVKITATPDEGYELNTYSVKKGSEYVVADNYEFKMPAEEVTVIVEFTKPVAPPPERPKHRITLTVIGGHGSTSPEASFETDESSVLIGFNPDRYYVVEKVTKNGLDVTSDVYKNSYSIQNIDADVEITVKFKRADDIIDPEQPSTYKLTTVVRNGNGTVSPSKVGIQKGTKETIIFTPNEGYEVASVKVNNQTQMNFTGNELVLTINENTLVEVEYKAKNNNPDPDPDPDPNPNPNPDPQTPKQFLVSFDMMGKGNQVPAQTIKENEKATKPQNPSATGYTFDGWYINQALTSVFDFNTPITTAITLYAKWTKNADTPINPPTPRPTEKGCRIFFDRLYNGDAYTLASTAEKGERVRIFTRPDPGYEVYSIVVRDARQRIISLDSETFVMPDSYVSIDVIFRDVYLYRPSYRDDDDRVYRPQREERKVERKDEAKEVEKESKSFIALKAVLTEGSKDLVQYIGDNKNIVKMDIAPYIKNGRTMLSVRYVSEALGFNVEWNHASRTVIIKDKENRIEIPVDTNKIIINGVATLSDVKPEISNNRTMLPIANIGRALGLEDGKDIFWNPITKSASITRNIEVK